MRVGLIQVGGSLPNVALMRLSTWHKQLGDDVILHALPQDNVDVCYVSSIFTWRRQEVEALAAQFRPNTDVIVGGPGSLPEVTALPPYVDAMRNDYDLAWPVYESGRRVKGLLGPIDYGIGYTTRGCIRKCGFCLTPDSPVITADGPLPISEVRVGMRVLTHTGRYRRVTETFVRPYEGNVRRLRNGAISELFPVRVTDEHPVLTRHVSYRGGQGGMLLTSFRWIEAKDIRPKNSRYSVDVTAYPRPTSSRSTKISVARAELIGWYLAEGYLSTTKLRGTHKVTFCLGHSELEMEYAKDIQRLAKEDGLKASIYHPKIGIRVVICNVVFARWLMREFGTGSGTKRLPLWVRQLPNKHLDRLVYAWDRGDGNDIVKRGTLTYRITTVSPVLAIGLREIALKLGLSATINGYTPKSHIQGRAVNAKRGYTVILHQPAKRAADTVQDKKYVYLRSDESACEWYEGPVWNLEVEDDHSYCTPSHALHNCPVPKIEGTIRADKTIGELLHSGSNKLLILDNNFFSHSDSWRSKLEEIRERHLVVDWPQGNDIRLMTPEIAHALYDLHQNRQIMGNLFSQPGWLHFAWDLPSTVVAKRDVVAGIRMLMDAGFTARHLRFYVLVGYWWVDSQGRRHEYELEEEIERCRTLLEFGLEPYVMVYRDFASNEPRDPRRMDLRQWCSGHAWKRMPFSEFRRDLTHGHAQTRALTSPMF